MQVWNIVQVLDGPDQGRAGTVTAVNVDERTCEVHLDECPPNPETGEVKLGETKSFGWDDLSILGRS